jgi:hypothetical protein
MDCCGQLFLLRRANIESRMIWLLTSTGRLVRTRDLRIDSVKPIRCCSHIPEGQTEERESRIRKLVRFYGKFDERGQRIRA